ncbi:MAG: hypothetical protein F6K39_03075 [Okeania sp. SIO3B3]|nr:hypothetical protein [Okeania sp. SIO3B3]
MKFVKQCEKEVSSDREYKTKVFLLKERSPVLAIIKNTPFQLFPQNP